MGHETNRTSGGFSLTRKLTLEADRTVAALFEACSMKNPGHWCIVALGGYGRQELCPFSDLDLLFLIEKKVSRAEVEAALKEMLYPLWNAGYAAGYSIRTIGQVIQDLETDFYFRTSLIDARYVCGSKKVFAEFTDNLGSSRFIRRTNRFVSDLIFHTRKRHEKYGDSVYFLEPHIKDGHGGLRDYQSIVWLAKIFDSVPDAVHRPMSGCSEYDGLTQSADFMLKTRYLLHERTGRKIDQMHLEYQEMLADELGYRAKSGQPAVEAFLKDFHTGALTIRTVFDGLLQSIEQPKGFSSLVRKGRERLLNLPSGRTDVFRVESLKNTPDDIFEAFIQSGVRGIPLTPSMRSQIKSFIKNSTDLSKNPAACKTLLQALQLTHAEKSLIDMLETGFIEALIPEFRTIRGKAIFDVYHTYTIDLHSIHTVCELKKLDKSEAESWDRVLDKGLLFFSAFLHDIGKGYGRPHALLGSEAIEPIAMRFGFNRDERESISFLVRNHLIMAEIASRRDLSEEKVINDFAQNVGNISRLSMLYLLTIADSKATGPNAWNDWKASLLWELCTRTIHILETGILRNPKDALRLEEKWHQLVNLEASPEGAFFKGRLWALPQAYVHTSEFDDIKRHLSLSAELEGDGDIKVETALGKSHVLLTIITRNRPGLFSLLTGILAVHRIDIISAKIFTWYDGTVVDTFRVLPPWKDYGNWHAIRSLFKECLSGTLDIESRLVGTKALMTGEPVPVRTTEGVTLAVDNESSDFFTIIDVRAHKRIGLIHDISRSISVSGLDIHRALLSRNSDLVSSVFYVVDAGGEKMSSQARIHEVLGHIREAIEIPRFHASPLKEKKVYTRVKKETRVPGD